MLRRVRFHVGLGRNCTLCDMQAVSMICLAFDHKSPGGRDTLVTFWPFRRQRRQSSPVVASRRQSSPVVASRRQTSPVHSIHSTHSIHSIYGIHSIHSRRSVCSIRSVESVHSTHSTHSMHSMHRTNWQGNKTELNRTELTNVIFADWQGNITEQN